MQESDECSRMMIERTRLCDWSLLQLIIVLFPIVLALDWSAAARGPAVSTLGVDERAVLCGGRG